MLPTAVARPVSSHAGGFFMTSSHDRASVARLARKRSPLILGDRLMRPGVGPVGRGPDVLTLRATIEHLEAVAEMLHMRGDRRSPARPGARGLRRQRIERCDQPTIAAVQEAGFAARTVESFAQEPDQDARQRRRASVERNRMARLVQHHLRPALQIEHHGDAEAFILRLPFHVDALGPQFLHGRLNVVAHEADLVRRA